MPATDNIRHGSKYCRIMASVVERLGKEKEMVFLELSQVCSPWPSFLGDSEALSHVEVPVQFWVH